MQKEQEKTQKKSILFEEGNTPLKVVLWIVLALIIIGLAGYVTYVAYFQKEPEIQQVTVNKSVTQDKEKACADSGGTIAESSCCKSVEDFPDSCVIGACGCSPDSSHTVKTCDCGEGKCFDGEKCVSSQTSEAEKILCTGETKKCSDGTEVQRDPENNCEFKECPVVDEYVGWETYTNDIYNYTVKYPAGAEIIDNPWNDSEMPEKTCIQIKYKDGYVLISSTNDRACTRTGVGDGVVSEKEKSLTINGEEYNGPEIEYKDQYDDEGFGTIIVRNENINLIEYEAKPYTKFTEQKEDLYKIIESIKF